ncbi:MAG: oligosaccharyl transferase, archaeosortase A system-associated, partial [Methanosarcinales archaeon]
MNLNLSEKIKKVMGWCPNSDQFKKSTDFIYHNQNGFVSFNPFKKESLIYGIPLIAIFAFSLYIRVVLPQSSVFVGDIVRFGGNNPWYHMRLVDTILHNYPHWLFYDAYTHYPYGSFVPYGPLFDFAIATIALIIGLGHPSVQLVNNVGAYLPAILGALVVFPVYYLGKHLNNRPTGLFAAAIIAILPGQFLSRSILGFTDQHVAEALLSAVTILFFLIAFKTARDLNIRFGDLKTKNWNANKAILFAILAGIAYASYQLVWSGGYLFGLIIVIAVAIQYIADHLRGKSTDYLGIVGIIAFFVGMLLILPFIHPEFGFSTQYYSWFHVVIALVAVVAFAIMSLGSIVNKFYYPLGLFVFVGICILIINGLMSSFGIFQIFTGGAATIAEASSIFRVGILHDIFTKDSMIFGNFGLDFHFSIIAILLLFGYIIAKWRIEETLLLVWTLVIFVAMTGQNKFAYYYAVNIAILCGYFGIKIIDAVNKLQSKYTEISNPIYMAIKGIILVLLIAILIYPFGTATMAMQQAKYGGGPNMEWYKALTWLRYNTPSPELDYYEIYKPPKNGEKYNYPKSAYGVMSWWDYGSWIEVIGRRIPNVNDLFAEIGGGKQYVSDASAFFTANNEKDANSWMDKLGSRYVISDIEMATGKFYAITAWAGDTAGYFTQHGPSAKYYNSMEAQLHILDARKLNHYRLVHESTSGYYGQAEIGYKQVYNILS